MNSIRYEYLSLSSPNDVRYVRSVNRGTEPTKVLPTVLMLHGCPGSIADCMPILEKLSNSFQVFAVDRPGFGGTKCLNYPTNFDGSAKFIEDFVTKLGLRPIALIGHSYGGYISLRLADSLPSVRKLVLIGTPFYSFSNTRYLPGGTLRLITVLKKWGLLSRFPFLYQNPLAEKAFRENLPRYYSPGFLTEEKLRDCLSELTPPSSLKRMYEELGSLIEDLGLLEESMKHTTLPCLVMNGTDEDPSILQQAARFCGGSNHRETVSVKQSAHYPHVEHPEQASQFITQFLEQ